MADGDRLPELPPQVTAEAIAAYRTDGVFAQVSSAIWPTRAGGRRCIVRAPTISWVMRGGAIS
jgi:hypothetical protein